MSVRLACFIASCQMAGLVFTAAAEEPLPASQRTNGAETLKPLATLQTKAAQTAVALGKTRDETASGVVLSDDGYVLTKASDANALKPLRAFFSDGTEAEARLVKSDTKMDLLVLKVERTGLAAIQWGESLPLQAGEWLAALTKEKEVRIGVVAALRRAIPNSGTVMGIRMGADDPDAGVLIEDVAQDSPAERAGIKAEDLVTAIDGKSVSQNAAFGKMISGLNAGDTVKIDYLRQGKAGSCEVRLASKNRVLLNWSGEDFANHGTSLRTDNFPLVLQHNLPLRPADMGSALFDLRGRAVGLNIARVDRVTNYALPVESFINEVLRWIRDDRAKHPPKL